MGNDARTKRLLEQDIILQLRQHQYSLPQIIPPTKRDANLISSTRVLSKTYTEEVIPGNNETIRVVSSS
ncbi:Protein of unknown function [Gryllus bimaculatus]|nr:Protein of unknown function [Gryllus bimaculatus]